MSKPRALPGSEREAIAGAAAAGRADPAERFEVSVRLRRRAASAFEARLAQVTAPATRGTPPEAGRLSREEYAQRFGADPADIATLRRFAATHGLTVSSEDAARRTVRLSGTVTQFNAAFGVDLQRFTHPGGGFRGFTGPLHLPDELHDVVEAVLGLDDRPQARPHFRIGPEQPDPASRAAAPTGSFTPVQLASVYGFPAGTGKGECIALIELGGGFRPADLNTYFSGLGVSPPPTVVAVGVDGAANAPTGQPGGPDGEVMLDIEVAGAVAPGARIAVYFAPNTDAGFLDAITTAIHDTTNRPSVISISWGGPESSWSKQALTTFDQAFQTAATLGITVFCASGDNGSSDGLRGDHVDFPASSPHVVGCGGTHLVASGGKIASESVWNHLPGSGAGGGGVSTAFALPAWQHGLTAKKTSGTSAALKKRGVPDVAADADPQTGYTVRVDGQNLVFGGTSAVAPLWAGLVARLNARKGSTLGFINPVLYANPQAFHDVAQGNNGDFAAASGWDACTGLGSPNGAALATTFGA